MAGMEPKNGLVIAIDIRPLMGNKVSGVEVYTHHLLKYLFKIDKKNTYILFTNASKNQHYWLPPYDPKQVIFIETKVPNKLLNLSLSLLKWPKLDQLIIKKLQKLKKFTHIDVFFFPDLRLSALTNKVKKVQVIHDLSFEHYPNFFSLKTQFWYKLLRPKREMALSHHIIAVSNATKKDLQVTYKIDPTKIQVIYEGVEENFVNDTSIQEQVDLYKKYHLPERYFLFLATMEPRKNMRRIIEAFHLFKDRNPHEPIKLVMAGIKHPKIFSDVHLPKFSKDIIWPGFIEEKDKPALIKNAQAFLYPSLFEGFGLPLVEAMKCKTPIVTSNKSSMPEIVGNAGLLVNPENVDEIAQALEEILQPKLRKILKEKMGKRVGLFNWERCAKETLEIFESSGGRCRT